MHHAPVHSPLESWGPTVVPEGKLFVMGDNRDNSSDSRDWGFVPMSNVIGEPLFVYWSYDAPTSRWLDENPRPQDFFLRFHCRKLLLQYPLEPHRNVALASGSALCGSQISSFREPFGIAQVIFNLALLP